MKIRHSSIARLASKVVFLRYIFFEMKNLSVFLAINSIALIACGDGIAQVQGTWEIGRNGYVPPSAFRTGVTERGTGELYVCGYGKAVGKLVPSHGTCYLPYGGKEHSQPTYSVLIGSNYKWIPLTGGIPRNIVIGAPQQDGGENVYICRVGGSRLGKFVPSHDVCYYPYGGKEWASRSMQVLVRD